MDHPELYLPFPLCLYRDSFLKEAIGDGDGVAATLVIGRAMHDARVSIALLPADVADEAVDAAEDHRHEDDHARHQDLGGDGGGRGDGSGGQTKVVS